MYLVVSGMVLDVLFLIPLKHCLLSEELQNLFRLKGILRQR